MDTSIEEIVTVRKRKKAWYIILLSIAIMVICMLLLRSSLATSIKKSVITTAVVEKGNIENTITASGEVIPEFEAVITSPINASIQKVVIDAGSKVTAGSSILTLDKSASQTEFEKLQFQLASKENDVKKLKLQLDKSFFDIKSSNDIKQLRINSLEAEVENARRLFKAGGGTRENIEQAELNLKVARLEKQQLENEIKSKQQTMQVEMKEAGIAAAIQGSELQQLQRKLKQADIVASRDGVVTWVNKNLGAAIHEGDALARIADLGSFKVQGSVSDSYLDQLHNAMPAIIRINETQIRGSVVNIQPSVQNGLVSFSVQLNEQNHALLRPNMKVEVFLVTAARNNVLRIANGPAFKGAASQDIFVVNNGKAERRSVHVGMTNFDFVELLDNMKPGEVVITSDMSAFKNAKEITINQ